MSEPLTLVIGSKRWSSWSLRPWLALRQAGAAFDEVLIPLRQGEATKAAIRRHSPSGKVPYLRHGSVEVWESIAICAYVAEAFPEARLWPTAPAARAHCRSVAAEMHAGFAPLRKALPMDIAARHPLPALDADVEADIARILSLWNDGRSRYADGGPYLFGRFTVADCMYAPVVTRFTTYGVSVPSAAEAYMEAIWSLPAMKEWRDAAAVERDPS